RISDCIMSLSMCEKLIAPRTGATVPISRRLAGLASGATSAGVRMWGLLSRKAGLDIEVLTLYSRHHRPAYIIGPIYRERGPPPWEWPKSQWDAARIIPSTLVIQQADAPHANRSLRRCPPRRCHHRQSLPRLLHPVAAPSQTRAAAVRVHRRGHRHHPRRQLG